MRVPQLVDPLQTRDLVAGRSHGARIRSSVSQCVPVARWKTWTAMMLAFGATPEKSLPCPAAIPATWVPCLQPLAA